MKAIDSISQTLYYNFNLFTHDGKSFSHRIQLLNKKRTCFFCSFKLLFRVDQGNRKGEFTLLF